MFSLWGFPESTEKIKTSHLTPEQVEEAKLKREAEKKVEESGQADCSFCKEEIVKNERGFWESAFLLEYCTDARDHKHKPKIVWKQDE